jgi:cytochrome bd-type quinol oxidase subunit 2
MIETIVGGLFVAAVSGLSFLAYKHPKGYSKIGSVTYLFISVCFLIYVVWVFGYQQGFYDGKLAETASAKPEYPVEPFPWLVLAILIILAYLKLLQNLPRILEIDYEKEKGEGDEE